MGLREYHRKRDFSVTPEPRGEEKTTEGRSFCVQKHAASHLHYDFRLELEGVLKSWSVPKGPSFDPAVRRLAMQTEDHPVDYGDFEGIIPEGEYGGGTVLLWDRGTWEPLEDPHQGLRKGSLKFDLFGEKLRGRWALVKIRGREKDDRTWLLIKDRDEHARRGEEGNIVDQRPESVATGRQMEEIAAEADRVWHSNRGGRPGGEEKRPRKPADLARRAAATPHARKAPLPTSLQPELATLVPEPPETEAWLHEMKFDGYRILAFTGPRGTRLVSRNGKDWTGHFPSVARAVDALGLGSAVIDGEVAAVLPSGTTSFQALQNALSAAAADLVYFVFDLPYLEGHDLRRAPLEKRKALLAAAVRGARGRVLRYSDHVVGGGRAFFAEACRMGLEGIISKRRDAPYESGRARSWVKVKCLQRQEFVIGGYTDPEGARVGIGALLLGVHDASGRLLFAGKVGTGFTAKTLTDLERRLVPLRRTTSPFEKTGTIAGVRKAHWVEPRLVCEVAFTEWTEDGRLRHPSFQGLREDKPPEAIVRERPRNAVIEEPKAPPARRTTKAAARKKAPKAPARRARHRITG